MLVGYGPEPLSIESFVERALPSLGKRFVSTQHRLSNVSVQLTGETARVEAYVLAFHVEAGDAGRRLHTFAGRYIDSFETRGGRWKIAQRVLRNDWSTVEAMGDAMTGTWIASGRAGSPDPIFD